MQEIVKDLIDKDVNKKLNLVHCGVKTIDRSNNKNIVMKHRPSQEGVHLIQRYLTKRNVLVSKSDFGILLSTKEIISKAALSQPLQEELDRQEPGSIIFVLEGVPPENKLLLSYWMSNDR